MTFFDILKSQVIIIEENVLLFNKAQSEKKFDAFNAVFRVDVNDVKPFQKITGRLQADHPQSMRRIFKKKQKKTIVDSKFAFLTIFQQFTTGVRLVTRIPA